MTFQCDGVTRDLQGLPLLQPLPTPYMLAVSISIGNHMISRAIWNKEAQLNFSKTNKTAQAFKASAIWGLWKIYKYLFIQNCTRKIMWLLTNGIQEKILRWLSRRNPHVSHNQGKIASSWARAWFENKRFDWSWPIPIVHYPIKIQNLYV